MINVSRRPKREAGRCAGSRVDCVMDQWDTSLLIAIAVAALLGLFFALVALFTGGKRTASPPPITPTTPNDVTEPYQTVRHIALPVLVAKRLAFATRGTRSRKILLHNATLDLYPGEVACIVGTNGSGKSTLMKMLALNEKPTSGSLTICGQSTTDMGGSDLDDVRARCIHYLPQDGLGLLGVSPIENITRILKRLDGIEGNQARDIAERSLARTGLPTSYFDKRLADHPFSGGERARIAVACALASARPICLADEILGPLDDLSVDLILTLFRELARDSNTSVAIIVHQLSLEKREAYFDRTLIIGGVDPAQETPGAQRTQQQQRR